MAVNAQDYALVIGINDYPFYRPLKGAIEDAREFEKWLLDTQAGAGVPVANRQIVLSKANPIVPVLEEIDEALLAIMNQVRKGGPGRRFYLFFSGHGMVQTEKEEATTAFCLAKWSDDRRNLALDSECYVNYVIQSGQFSEVVLFADCCRVRKVSVRGFCPSLGNIIPSPTAGSVRKFLAFATELMVPAFEVAVGAVDGPVRGHFSRALMNALWGAAARPQGGVSATELEKYLYAEVPRIAKEHNHNQRPEVERKFDPQQEPIFGSAQPTVAPVAAAAVNVVIQFANPAAGQIRLEGPEFENFRYCNANIQNWELALEPGLYILREETTGRERHFRVRPSKEVLSVAF